MVTVPDFAVLLRVFLFYIGNQESGICLFVIYETAFKNPLKKLFTFTKTSYIV